MHHPLFAADREQEAAFSRCEAVAAQDFDSCMQAFGQASATLEELRRTLEAGIDAMPSTGAGAVADAAEHVSVQLSAVRKELTEEVQVRLDETWRTRHAKQRSLRSFTIVFMGKTKAGKSTLHAVLTGEGFDAIGSGGQRTTRRIREYRFRGMRILDTPGIGAPGGQADEEIAQSVVEEADLICYVVTNDSQQKSEFRFLERLKERGKPLVILLNVQEDLTNPERCARFLRAPDRPFRREGSRGLGGHIERIRRYARKHYANDHFEIIPVHLLAARIAREEPSHPRALELLHASRVHELIDTLHREVVEHGILRRSQTLLGGAIGELREIANWIASRRDQHERTARMLMEQQQNVLERLRRVADDCMMGLEHDLRHAFGMVRAVIPGFAETHWDAKVHVLRAEWEGVLGRLRLQERTELALDAAEQRYAKEVRELLDEVGQEMRWRVRLERGAFVFTEQDASTFFRDVVRWGGISLLFAGGPLAFLGSIMSIFSQFMASKSDKRRNAVSAMAEQLNVQLAQEERRAAIRARESFGDIVGRSRRLIEEYLGRILGGSEGINTALMHAENQLRKLIERLDRAYAARIVSWAYEGEKHVPTSGDVLHVEHVPGRRMRVVCRFHAPPPRTNDELARILQHETAIELLAL